MASVKHAQLAAGFTAADSWALDAHKWLNVPYDSGIALVADASALAEAISTSGAYLFAGDRRDAINLMPESSRRARAIEIWAALKSFGRSGLSELIDRNCRQAQRLADGLRKLGIGY